MSFELRELPEDSAFYLLAVRSLISKDLFVEQIENAPEFRVRFWF